MTRVLACLAIGAWVFLLWPFPITTFMATCMACVTYPAYRKLHRKMSPSWAMTTYTVGLAAITILPIATVVSLVTPQAVAGLKILDGLRDSGWIHSPEAQAWFASVDAWLKNLPGLECCRHKLTRVSSISKSEWFFAVAHISTCFMSLLR